MRRRTRCASQTFTIFGQPSVWIGNLHCGIARVDVYASLIGVAYSHRSESWCVPMKVIN